MAKWSPPKIFVHRQPDGTLVVVDDAGNLVPTPPTLKIVHQDDEMKALDPWGNEVPTYRLPEFFVHTAADGTLTAVDASGVALPAQPQLSHYGGEGVVSALSDGSPYEPAVYQFPAEFFVHTAADGTLTAVDASGVALPTQPQLSHWGGEGVVAALSDGSPYEPAVYQFPAEFFVHTAADGTLTAVDASGVALPTQPQLSHWGGEGVVRAALSDGSPYEPAVYQFPAEFFVHTAADGTLTAVDASGVALPTQPQLSHWGVDGGVRAALSDGSPYEPAVYQFPAEFFVHTAADGTLTAVDASGVALPTQPQLSHWGVDGGVRAALSDGSPYEPKPLYPPAGEPPEVWPPEDATDGETEEEDEPAAEDEAAEVEPASPEEVIAEGFSEDLLTAGLVDVAPVPHPSPDPAHTEAVSDAERSSEVELDGKGDDVAATPELKWDEAQEDSIEMKTTEMDPDPVDMDPDPVLRAETEFAVEEIVARAAAEVAAASAVDEVETVPEMKFDEVETVPELKFDEVETVPEMKFDEVQENAIGVEAVEVEPGASEEVEFTVVEVIADDAVAVEEVVVDEVLVESVEVEPVILEEAVPVEEPAPPSEEDESVLDD